MTRTQIPVAPADPHPGRRETAATIVRAVVIVLLGAALVGGLSSPAQGALPDWLRSLANSAGGWSMFTFLLVWLSRGLPVLAAVLGVVAFEVMLESYGLVSLWRGGFYADPFSNSFTVPGIVAGVLLGIGASFVRYGSPRNKIVGVLPLSIVLIAEGAYGLIVIADTTSPVYWAIEMVAGVASLATALVRARGPGASA